MRREVPGYIADAIVGHGDKKKSLQALYLNISDQQLLDAVDMMKFDTGETDIRVKKCGKQKVSEIVEEILW